MSAKRLNCLNDPDFNSNCQIKHSHSCYFEWNGRVGEKIDAQLTRYIHIAADAAYSATTENAEADSDCIKPALIDNEPTVSGLGNKIERRRLN